MTLQNISFSQFIVGKLRQNLTDYNLSNRSATFGQYIYPDKPMITKLLNNKNNFPRISVELLNMPTVNEMGMGCTEHEQTVSLKINVYSVRDLICIINTETDESHTYITGTDVYELDILPYSDITSITGIKDGNAYIFIKNIDYQIYDSDSDGMRDSVKWVADIPDNGTNFLVTYKRNGTSQELCRIISKDINTYLRDEWRNWSNNLFWSYRLLSSNPVDFDEHLGVSRYEMTIQFSGINIGDEI